MAITPPPTPPNTGNPAQLEERADAFFGWFPSFVTDFNNDLALLRGKTWAARTGSANAITLTAGVEALTTGTQVRFRAGFANTGATTINLDSTGAISCRTIVGVALPAGYIRTDTETVATYDGTFWVVDRQIERGGNANGIYSRFADGTQICLSSQSATSSGDGGRSMRYPWTYPAIFVSTPIISITPRLDTAIGYGATTSDRINFGSVGAIGTDAGFAFVDIYRSAGAPDIGAGASILIHAQAIGRWY